MSQIIGAFAVWVLVYINAGTGELKLWTFNDAAHCEAQRQDVARVDAKPAYLKCNSVPISDAERRAVR